MPAPPTGSPRSEHHGDDDDPSLTESETSVEEMELFLDRPESPLHLNSSSLELDGEEFQDMNSSWSQDGELQLERRWVLWHEFMKEHAHLDTWLRLAEQTVSSPNHAHIDYITAKEELRKFERLRREAGSLLIRLDSLTRRNRALTRLFDGTMRARLLASTRTCGQRWDELSVKLESITARLKLFVSEWEEFEAERAELALLLADLDVRLSEVDHLTGSTCEKLRRLQSFQQCVCMNSARVNALLQRGEALIQRSEPTDAQHVENRLLELLRGCSLSYNNIARTHTRLLSMRLVFEDDWILSQATDSGCPSESLLEEDGALDKTNLDVSAPSNHRKANLGLHHSPVHLAPPPPSSSPTHEHLEWDPSVDVGRSVSRDDADSSYFSVSTGLCHRDGVKRRSYISSLDSQSDINNDVFHPEADSRPEERRGPAHSSVMRDFSPIALDEGQTWQTGEGWMSSTPERDAPSFDGGRVRAWLGEQSPTPLVKKTSCCKAVQTDGGFECYSDGSALDSTYNHPQHIPAPTSSSACHQTVSTDWLKHQSSLQPEEEPSCGEESERVSSEQSVTSTSRPSSSSSSLSPALLYLLLAAALVLLACLIWVVLEPPCHRSSRMPRSFHLALRYVNGPPPT